METKEEPKKMQELGKNKDEPFADCEHLATGLPSRFIVVDKDSHQRMCEVCYLRHWQDLMQVHLSSFSDAWSRRDMGDVARALMLIEMGVESMKRSMSVHYFGDCVVHR